MSASTTVANGISLLNSQDSEWMNKVDFTKLDMASGDLCILGQLYGSYATGVRRLGLGVASASNNGFITNMSQTSEQLTETWKATFLPEVGKVYKANGAYQAYDYLKIKAVVGLDDTMRILAQPMCKNYEGKLVPETERQYITRNIRAIYESFTVMQDAPKPGSFLVSSDGTKFFVANNGRLWNMSRNHPVHSTFNDTVTQYGKLEPLLTVSGRKFTTDISF